jgi:hypothetical protein
MSRHCPAVFSRFVGFLCFHGWISLASADPLAGKPWVPEMSERVALVGDAFFKRDYRHVEL